MSLASHSASGNGCSEMILREDRCLVATILNCLKTSQTRPTLIPNIQANADNQDT